MWKPVGKALFTVCLVFWLSSCASVDQFGSRINDSNLNSQYAMNQETLLNIVRASQYQALNFVAITQVAGGQTETLSAGLPTITFGPAKTLAQHQAVFGSNSLSSAITSSFQSNPLVSTQFQDGMLSPMPARDVALLVAAHPREPVYYAAINSIRLKSSSSNKVLTYNNNPLDDLDEHGNYDDQCLSRVMHSTHSYDKPFYFDDRVCSYSKFVNFLRVYIALGLFWETVPCPTSGTMPAGCVAPKAAGATPAPGATPAAGGSASTESYGRFCFDPAHAVAASRPIAEQLEPLCGTPPTGNAAPALNFAVIGRFTPEFDLRSPTGVYSYLGKLLHEGTADRVKFYTGEAQQQLGSFLNIVTDGATGNCYVSVSYGGQNYCVPQDSYGTALLLDILQELRNLSISPSDLNESFTVRVSD